MRRNMSIALVAITLAAITGADAFRIVGMTWVDDPPAGGVSTVFTEDFDTPGYDNTGWTEYIPASLDDQSEDYSVSGSYSFNGMATNGVQASINFDWTGQIGGETTNYYVRFYVYVPSGQGASDGFYFSFDDGSTAPDRDDNGRIRFNNVGHADRYIAYNIDAQTPQTTPLDLDAWVRVEFHYPSGAWKVDGVTMTQAGSDPSITDIGDLNIGGTTLANTPNYYIDAIAVSTNDWIGAD